MDRIALVLAAGEGIRMVSSTPKMLHQVCGIPMVEHVMRALESVCREQLLLVGQSSRAALEANYQGRVTILQQSEGGYGTGWAVKCAMETLKDREGVILVIAGDKPLVQPETLVRLVNEVESGHCSAAVLTARPENPFGQSRVIREGGRVKAIIEQKNLLPEQMNIAEVSCLVYAFDLIDLRCALTGLKKDARGDYHLSDVVRILSEGGKIVRSVPELDRGEGMGVNDRVQLAEADRLMRLRINRRHMRQGVTMIDPERVYIQPDVYIGKDTVIHPGCEIGRGSTIGAKCVLHAGCQIAFSRVGEGCVIGNSVMKNAVLGNGVRMEHCVVNGAVVGDGVSVEPFTVLVK